MKSFFTIHQNGSYGYRKGKRIELELIGAISDSGKTVKVRFRTASGALIERRFAIRTLETSIHAAREKEQS